jgi:hypothetical protein
VRSLVTISYIIAVFNAKDWTAITTISSSSKQSDLSKVGYYGLGFNSCYNFTDVPTFITGDKMAIFDPQRKYTNGKGGIKIDFVNKPIAATYPDQVEPFKSFGFDGRSYFQGTVFRLA